VYGNDIKFGMFCAGYLEGIYDACRVGWRKKNPNNLTHPNKPNFICPWK
jgi:hypothetical protein